jgi:NAD(P)-dependent dehydrogenase (short-subunit alcohol dehydrogenase family)
MLERFAREAIAELFYVNAVGPVMLANRLLLLLREDGVVAFTTSTMASMATYDSLGLPLYRSSRAVLNSLTRDFYLDASQSRPITVLNLDPGWVRTRLGGPTAPVSAEESARGLSVVIDERRTLDPTEQPITRDQLRRVRKHSLRKTTKTPRLWGMRSPLLPPNGPTISPRPLT